MTDIFGLFLFGVTFGVQEIRKEYHLDDDKKDEELDAYNKPQGLADGHAAEAVIVQVEDL
jgi:hypothetical protein